MADINKLLNKKGWTGKEVGKAIIASMLYDIEKQGQPHDPLFSQAELERMEGSLLNTDREYNVYGVYRELYSSIIDSFNRGQGLYQQFYNGFTRLFQTLTEAESTDRALGSIDGYPFIVTEGQYNRLMAQAKENNRAMQESYRGLFYTLIAYFMGDYTDTPPKAPKAIAAALKAAKKEAATNQRMIDRYNEDLSESETGYYTLPDGRRSDQMTTEEWQAAIAESAMQGHKLIVNGELASPMDTIEHFTTKRIIEIYDFLFRGAGALQEAYKQRTGKELKAQPTEITEALEQIADGSGTEYIGKHTSELAKTICEGMGWELFTLLEWHKGNPATDITKYDTLELLEYYANPEAGGPDERELDKEFKAEFPALHKAVTAFIEEKLPKLKGLTPAKQTERGLTWGELADAGIHPYPAFVEPTERDIAEVFTDPEEDSTENYSRRRRIINNGVAIVKNPNANRLNARGEYEQAPSLAFPFRSLDKLAGDPETAEEILQYRDTLIYPALSYLYAFNALMQILEECYDLPGLAEKASQDTTLFEQKMTAYNGFLAFFYHNVYGTQADKEQKRDLIKGIFSMLDYESLKPTPEAIAQVTAEIAKLGYSSNARKSLRYLDPYIDRLREGAM